MSCADAVADAKLVCVDRHADTDLPVPRKPTRWSPAIARRICSRTVVAATVVALAALVAAPERMANCGACIGLLSSALAKETAQRWAALPSTYPNAASRDHARMRAVCEALWIYCETLPRCDHERDRSIDVWVDVACELLEPLLPHSAPARRTRDREIRALTLQLDDQRAEAERTERELNRRIEGLTSSFYAAETATAGD